MECKEERIDLRETTAEEFAASQKNSHLVFLLNKTEPGTEEYRMILKELFGDNLGTNSMIGIPVNGAYLNNIKIGNNVFIGANLLAMARGSITIEDDVQIAANVQLLSNNHDLYDRMVLPCKPVLIKRGAWIGAGATILPGVCIGRYAVVGAASVVTKDIPDYAVAVGNPAKVIKILDAERFEKIENISEK